MRKVYKIYEVSCVNIDPQIILGDYGYGKTIINPTVLRQIYSENYTSKDEFNSLEEAEEYLKNNLISEYGDTYTILIEYRYESDKRELL